MSLDYPYHDTRSLLSLWRGEILVTIPRAPAPLRDFLSRKEIINHVAKLYGLTAEDLTGPSRAKRETRPRQHAMYLMRCELNEEGRPRYSRPQIGAALGGRDNCTVWKGIRAHCRRYNLAVPA